MSKQTDSADYCPLDYHRSPKPGKTAISITKPTITQLDLSMAYSPGVAEPVRAIADDPKNASQYTNRSNLIACISDGSAVLGLGNVGALASKPVMEGKAVLFKKFGDVDVFDIEVDTQDVEEFIQTVKNIAPTFGGINLEDISAPRCFEIERRLKEELPIPVFHDDQHGTAIITAAGLINALELQGKQLSEANIVCIGAGAAGIATLNLLIKMGASKDNVLLLDSQGVIHSNRDKLNVYKAAYARETQLRTLEEAMVGADVFLGLAGPDLVTPEMIKTMADNAIVFAMSNPDPEILPETVHATRDDIIMGTGRSDYPNQVNNVLGFPFIFRGALDVQATHITSNMQIACVKALAELTREPVPQSVLDAYGLDSLTFGPDYVIPKPLDPRLIDTIPPAIAQAAIDDGVAQINK